MGECERNTWLSRTPTGERAATLRRLRAAVNTEVQLWARGTKRMEGVRKGTKKPWLGLLNKQERDAVDAVHDDVKAWRRLKLYDLQAREQYLAEPDPHGERAATLKRLQAAYSTGTRLRAIGTQRMDHAAEGLPPHMLLEKTKRWLDFLDESERAAVLQFKKT
jgi:hypothetical protein